MKLNRILIFAVLAIVLAGSVSAFDFDFLTGTDDNSEKITVGGIDFNVPAGFSENEDYKLDNESISDNSTDYTFYMSSAGFEDDTKQKAIYMMVTDYGQYNVSDETLEYIVESMDAAKKTINGHDGYIAQAGNDDADESLFIENKTDDVYLFIYEQNGDLVYLGATDPSYFEQVIIE